MSRFTIGALVCVSGPNDTGRLGTVIEVLPSNVANNPDKYRVEFPEGDVKLYSDLELSPAGSGPAAEIGDVQQ